VVNVTPSRLYTRERTSIPLADEAKGALGAVWIGIEKKYLALVWS